MAKHPQSTSHKGPETKSKRKKKKKVSREKQIASMESFAKPKNRGALGQAEDFVRRLFGK